MGSPPRGSTPGTRWGSGVPGGRIGWSAIAEVVADTLSSFDGAEAVDAEDVVEADRRARSGRNDRSASTSEPHEPTRHRAR